MSHEPFRPEPAMGVGAYKTYAVRTPASHTRLARCEEVECEAWRNGWRTTLDISAPAAREAATWIETTSGRRYEWTLADTLLTLTFPPGQQCFAEHRMTVRPGLYVVRDGDHRGNPTGRRHTLSEQAWVDDFGEHQEMLAAEQRKG